MEVNAHGCAFAFCLDIALYDVLNYKVTLLGGVFHACTFACDSATHLETMGAGGNRGDSQEER